MLTRYRRSGMRGALALAIGTLIAIASVGVAQAQTIYFVTPSMDVSNACTTTTYVDDFGNTRSYASCTPGYTIYYTPSYEQYYFVNP